MGDDVELSRQGEVALVQLRRPAHANALRAETFDALRRVALALSDAPPRFVVLTGEGDDFCVGLDKSPDERLWQAIGPMVRSRDAHRAQELSARLRGPIDALARLPCPIVAAIEGRCHGAGLELALVADLRVAAADATFAYTDAVDGLVTGFGGIVRGALTLGLGRATGMLLTARQVDAAEAVGLGLCVSTCARGGALSAALELVQDLRRVSPAARQQLVLTVRAVHNRLAGELADAETQAASRTWIAPDWQIAQQARKNGQEPSF